jgi:hypothetical protein
MNHNLKITLMFAALSLILSGCIPMPHHARLAPPVAGVIQNGNMPLSNASVYLDATFHSDNCYKYDLVAKTDQNGEFKIGPIEEFRWIAFIYGDPVANWTLCVDTTNGRKILLRQGGIGMPPWKLDVKCDISKSETSYIEAFGSIQGKCTER